ncbi:metallophosphoesterase [uncultured Helcococcus sp.]|uniref:metallophosphoesterase n=1 Tax=uncultured Helcococcus sp. TaxID=1072508 RepID=UPI00288A0A35|nr:metallophosphoesterase [uncultured Helcococcus sp.]
MKIYHTNDIHSNFDFYKKTSAYINENKNDEDLYLDSGDFADLSNFIVQADRDNQL